MDPATIASAVVAFLVSCLTEGGKALAKKAVEALWDAVERRLRGNPASEKALESLRKNPQDQRIQGTLEWQLEEVLRADPDFLAELARLLEDAQKEAPAVYQATLQGSGAIAQGPGAVAAGERGVAIGGDARGNIIITGDRNKVR
uniref:Hypothetical conserved protein n=1 Tax=uncultured prokaryote TaxID=198431 RepID=H5SKD5_9ZZZZ|nr:hypothetical conserved protein [uncultured prokaryote]